METWVINDDDLSASALTFSGNVNFVSNSTYYSSIDIRTNEAPHHRYIYYDSTLVWDDPTFNFGWRDQAYRTVTFDDPLDLTTPIGQWFSANAVKQTPSDITFDLTNLSLPSGRHEIQFSLSDDGLTKRDSLHSNTVYYDVPYNVTANVTNAIVTGSPTIMPFSQSTRNIIANDYYVNPETVTVMNATLVSYVKSTGVVTFENPTHDVYITGACSERQFVIAKNAITNGTLTGDDYITHFETKIVTIVPNADYVLPETIEVTNADYEYDAETGEVTLYNATGYVTVEAECPPEIEQIKPCLVALDEDEKTVLITPVDETTRGNEVYVESIAVKDTFGGVTTLVEIIPRDGYDVEQDGSTVYIKTAPATQNGSEVTIT